MGNHTKFCQRFPKEFDYFKGNISKAIYGKTATTINSTRLFNLNCYDNSVLYNDYVVSQIFTLTNKLEGVTATTYISDHGINISPKGKLNDMSNFDLVDIPLLISLSRGYKDKYPETTKALQSNINEPFPNDLLYDAMIGITNIKTSHYDDVFDIASNNYNKTQWPFLVYNGKKQYLDIDNIAFHQTNNIQKLINLNLQNRIIPHRVNTVGKAKQLLEDEMKAFELDLHFKQDKNNKAYFLVGHDSKYMSGQTFSAFLENLDHPSLTKLWLDIKNLNGRNVEQILEHLIVLDKTYSIKSKGIIETGFRGKQLEKISNAGFHTSYYLPTVYLNNLLNENSTAKLIQTADSIINLIEHQKLKAVSFDFRLYPFVKKYLEPRLISNIVYHTWDLGNDFGSPSFLSSSKQRYLQDPLLKTILVPYSSEFDL